MVLDTDFILYQYYSTALKDTTKNYYQERYRKMSTYKEDLKKQAQQAICTCYHYELANILDDLTTEELQHVINVKYSGHLANDDDLAECPEYQAEQAEAIRDGLREDGIAV